MNESEQLHTGSFNSHFVLWHLLFLRYLIAIKHCSKDEKKSGKVMKKGMKNTRLLGLVNYFVKLFVSYST